MTKKLEPKRSVKIEGLDLELQLSKAASPRTGKKFIHLDELPDGTWRLLYSPDLIPDFTKVEALRIIREN